MAHMTKQPLGGRAFLAGWAYLLLALLLGSPFALAAPTALAQAGGAGGAVGRQHRTQVLTFPWSPDAAWWDTPTGHLLVVGDTGQASSPGKGRVSIVDLRHGRVTRTITLPGYSCYPAFDPAHGRLFLGVNCFSQDGSPQLLALSPLNATVLFTVPFAYGVGPVTLDDQRERVFVGPTLLSARTGAPLVTLPVNDQVHSVALAKRTGAFFVALENSGAVAAFNTAGPLGPAMRVRRISVGGTPGPIAMDEGTNRVFVSTRGVGISVIDATHLTVLGTVPVVGIGNLLVVARRTHRLVITGYTNHGDSGYSFVTTDSTVAPPGPTALIRTISVRGFASALAVDERRSRVYVALASGDLDSPHALTVVALDTVTGRLLDSTPIQTGILAPIQYGISQMSVDEGTGRLFVPNPLGHTVTILDPAP